ncbi:MAG: peptidoglycan bridge formation glycyltransferase FemA/FemB family protein [Caldilineaceae bacterium]|nr:peptidoglycan bridge formation glycyltransferase FemA/FemB family protein [Caldilineaceae bacterium]
MKNNPLQTTYEIIWDAFVDAHPQAHILQTSGWGSLKSAFGWWSRIVTISGTNGSIQAGALMLFRKVAGLTLAYIPKGPLTDWHDRELTARLLADLRAEAQRQGAILLKIEPDLPDSGSNRALLASYGFRPSPQTVQPRSTVWIDLRGDEETILGRMKSKWRYNVRLAERKGVTVRAGGWDDLRHFQALMAETGERDAFDVHSIDYYRKAFEIFVPEQGVFLFAEFEGEPLAAIVVLHIGETAWYLWGASSNRQRNRMPNHALQWAAIDWARDRGATRYDLWGIPDEVGQVALGIRGDTDDPVRAEDLPVDVNRFPDGDLWGVFRFKEGFGGSVERFVGAWDLPISAVGYGVYQLGLAVKDGGLVTGDRGLGKRIMRTISNPQSPIPCHQSPITSPHLWRVTLSALPAPHVLQSWEWGEIKMQTGWQAERYAVTGSDGTPRAAFQFLWRQPIAQLPLRVGYIPKGPVLDWEDDEAVDAVLARIEDLCRAQGCLFVKIDPDVAEGERTGRRLRALLHKRGWRFSPEQIQFKNTAYTDLTVDEESLMMAFKSKWRYNVRLAERRGIEIREGDGEDLRAFYELYKETSERDGFLVRPFDYYKITWETMLAAGANPQNPAGGALLLAEHREDAKPVAGLFLFRYGERAWYFYGASSERRRRDMPNHLLQWRAMQWAKAQGCTLYDWWGAPTHLDDPDDSMQGVWAFKEGFAADFRSHIGAWDWSPQPLLWSVYHRAMPLVLDWMRRRHG